MKILSDLVLKSRRYRRFDSKVKVTKETLIQLIELARLCPSGRNQQALKFLPISDQKLCDKVFPNLAWAGYLNDWSGPKPEEQPTGYVIILGDHSLGTNFATDLGITAQTMMLGAVEAGLGGCMIASVNKESLNQLLGISEPYDIQLVLALGKPIEEVVIDPMENGNIRYWRDEQQVHHVPKRSVEELMIFFDPVTNMLSKG